MRAKNTEKIVPNYEELSLDTLLFKFNFVSLQSKFMRSVKIKEVIDALEKFD